MSEVQQRRIGFGVALIILGAFLLLDNIGLIPFNLRYYLFSWQGILILMGTAILFSNPRNNAGWILILIGGFFLMPKIIHVPWFEMRIFWPLLLIVLGVMYILRQRGHKTPIAARPDGSMDFLDDTNLFGGGDIIVTSNNFKGGKITSIFGGSSYNLSKARLSAEPTVIDFFAIFGGSTFIVPADWHVKIDVTAIFGGFSDKRAVTSDQSINDPTKEIFIKGFVLFGGGEVKSF